MEQDFSSRRTRATGRASPVRAIVGVAVAALLLGAAATWLLLRPDGVSTDGIFRVLDSPDAPATPAPAQENDAAAPAPAPSASPPAPAEVTDQRVDQVVEQQGGLDQRIAAMEQRLARLDLQAQAAAGNAARAEGLLIVFATRRSIERGAPLGYLADQLRLRFGDARPNAVETVITASRNPVTLDQLIARLDRVETRLLGTDARRENGWTWFRREVSELFVIRREDSPSPAAEKRIERARLFLESARAGAAAAEIANLPDAEIAADWIADARRYSEVQRALELLELTAILEPRELRDSEGERVEQPAVTAQTANR